MNSQMPIPHRQPLKFHLKSGKGPAPGPAQIAKAILEHRKNRETGKMKGALK